MTLDECPEFGHGQLLSGGMSQVSSFSVKLAGTIMLGFGIGLAILAVWIFERQLSLHQAIETGAFVFITVLATLAAFCSVIGYRFLFNRPNRFGSALPPIGWKVLAGFFWLLGFVFVWAAIAHRQYSGLVGAVLTAALGHWCVLASRAPATQSIPSTILPPETSLIAVGGFLPAGF